VIRSPMIDHYVGISQGFHDAGIAVVNSDGSIPFAAHSERYSRKKNDPCLDPLLLDQLKITASGRISVEYYERQWLTNIRRLLHGQAKGSTAPMRYMLKEALLPTKLRSWAHHLSHAAAAFQTSPFDRSAVVIVDAVGEFDTASIWIARYQNGKAKYDKLWSRKYPHSLGLFYTAMTKRVGLLPMEDEYVLMGMSAYGRSMHLKRSMQDNFFMDVDRLLMKDNLHLGVDGWSPFSSAEDIAAAAQSITEDVLLMLHNKAKEITRSENVCYGGGVALNCKFNTLLSAIWRNVWICPNPGDCGSALGAAALGFGRKLIWRNAFLGHKIPGHLDVGAVVDELLTKKIVGVANGRAEWGPRALGNRSLLADPYEPNIKDRLNEIKQRQKYRPFAPAILSEHAEDWFKLDRLDYGYMQYAVQAKASTRKNPACHVDGTARVQVVKPDGSNMRRILEAWYARTGHPMLINTSLNIRGQPMVNNREDAELFQDRYGIRVIS